MYHPAYYTQPVGGQQLGGQQAYYLQQGMQHSAPPGYGHSPYTQQMSGSQGMGGMPQGYGMATADPAPQEQAQAPSKVPLRLGQALPPMPRSPAPPCLVALSPHPDLSPTLAGTRCRPVQDHRAPVAGDILAPRAGLEP